MKSINTLIYLTAAVLLVIAAQVVFRIFVRRDYQQVGRLTTFTSLLELLVWGAYMSMPYLYNPPEWILFLSPDVPVGETLRIVGIICILVGLITAFGTMFWFGPHRAFGLEVNKLIQTGPYHFSRNPQIVLGSLLVIGTFILWPSWYALGWVLLYAIVSHLMVLVEEEHLQDVYGQEYVSYKERVPRYLGLPSQ